MAAVSLSAQAQWPSHRAPSVGTQHHLCVLMFKISHRPDGKVADMLALTHTCTTANNASVKYSRCVPQLPSQFPIAPMGDSRFAIVCRVVVSLSGEAQ
jgi:hypothetical protein